jgi:hypothetical protein
MSNVPLAELNLKRFSQLLEETGHLCGCGQEKVDIVTVGSQRTLRKTKKEATDDGGLVIVLSCAANHLASSKDNPY